MCRLHAEVPECLDTVHRLEQALVHTTLCTDTAASLESQASQHPYAPDDDRGQQSHWSSTAWCELVDDIAQQPLLQLLQSEHRWCSLADALADSALWLPALLVLACAAIAAPDMAALTQSDSAARLLTALGSACEWLRGSFASVLPDQHTVDSDFGHIGSQACPDAAAAAAQMGCILDCISLLAQPALSAAVAQQDVHNQPNATWPGSSQADAECAHFCSAAAQSLSLICSASQQPATLPIRPATLQVIIGHGCQDSTVCALSCILQQSDKLNQCQLQSLPLVLNTAEGLAALGQLASMPQGSRGVNQMWAIVLLTLQQCGAHATCFTEPCNTLCKVPLADCTNSQGNPACSLVHL